MPLEMRLALAVLALLSFAGICRWVDGHIKRVGQLANMMSRLRRG